MDRPEGKGRSRWAEEARSLCDTIVLHGPEVFDSGDARMLIDLFRPCRSIVAGVMARTAAEESGLHLEYAGVPPSNVFSGLPSAAFLATRGKTTESGRIFGEIVSSRLGRQGLVQVDCRAEQVYLWGRSHRSLARALSGALGYGLEYAALLGTSRNPGEREVRGCLPGEAVFVNGIVIGYATGKTVVIAQAPVGIRAVSGLLPKQHGLEKLAARGPLDLASAWCKSGPVRSRPPAAAAGVVRPSLGRILVVDHAAVDLYRLLDPGVCGVLSIGDDTTSVCGHIASHLGIPVFGIVDGDEDGIVPPGFAGCSVVVKVQKGTDDEVGREIALQVGTRRQHWEEFVESTLGYLGDRVTVVVRTGTPT